MASLDPAYNALCQQAKADLADPAVTDALITCVDQSLEVLSNADRVEMVSEVPNKTYFAFRGTQQSPYISRGINQALYLDDRPTVVETLRRAAANEFPANHADLHAALYTAAISFPASTDITKQGDRKRPATFFENLVGHLVSRFLGSTPKKSISVPTLDVEVSLPTDFVFDLGTDRSRIHLPIKMSTRERVIQAWAHQRVLDGMHGVNRFRGLLVVLAETNRRKATSTAPMGITEVCLPGQWVAYQMYIAQLYRVYYFDRPAKYATLADRYPFLQVKHFAELFYEYDQLTGAT